MATLTRSKPVDPVRCLCPSCTGLVIVALVPGRDGLLPVVADAHEWEPRAICQSCLWTRRRTGRAVSCPRCDNSGYVGERRPVGRMLALDVAWSDDGHIRVIAASTPRRRGEALYPLHPCVVRVQFVTGRLHIDV